MFGNGRNWRSRSRRFDGVLHPQLLDQVHRLPGAALVSVGFGDDFRVEGIAQSGDRSCRLAIVIVLVVHLSGVFEESRVADGNAAAGNVKQFAFVEFKDIVARAADVAAARPLFLFLFLVVHVSQGQSSGVERPLDRFRLLKHMVASRAAFVSPFGGRFALLSPRSQLGRSWDVWS